MEYNQNQTIELEDGRRLGFAEYGKSDGQVVLYFHGLPGSRLEARHLHEAALANNIRLIGLDRPGMGLSCMQHNRSILSWVKDVQTFVNCMHIPQFSVIGHSGGAPFVAACALFIPERLHGVAIVSGMAPLDNSLATSSLTSGQRLINKMIKRFPWIASLMMKFTAMMLNHPFMLKQMLRQLPRVDQDVFRDLQQSKEVIEATKEAFRNGIAGSASEIILTLKPWGFNLENIKFPITIWQGKMDKQAPEMHAKLYAKLLPHAKLIFFKNEGHLSILKNKGELILQAVCKRYD